MNGPEERRRGPKCNILEAPNPAGRAPLEMLVLVGSKVEPELHAACILIWGRSLPGNWDNFLVLRPQSWPLGRRAGAT